MSASLVLADGGVSREEALRRVEAVVRQLVTGVCSDGVVPALRLVARTTNNAQISSDGEGDGGDGDGGAGGMSVLRLGAAASERSFTNLGSTASYVRVFRALAACYQLLLAGRSVSQRELYYMLKGSGPSMVRCADQGMSASILDAACLLSVQRRDLGITASSKGEVFGRLRYWDGREVIECRSSSRPIPGDTDVIATLQFETDARCVVVVEKDAVFQSLRESGFCDPDSQGGNGYPAILITAKGMPDLGTRAFLRRLHDTRPDLPVFGLVDWNPSGVSILRTYRWGSARMGLETPQHAIRSLLWLGVHSFDLASASREHMQRLTRRDDATLRSLRAHGGIQREARWLQELSAMEEKGSKAEIEAVYTRDGFDTLGAFLKHKIMHGEFF